MKKAFGLLALACATQALATVDAVIPYTIVSKEIQTDDVCLTKMPMIAELGIPAASMAQATFAPALVTVQSSGRGIEHDNVNLLATTPAIGVNYLDGAWDESNQTITEKFELDFTALARANGTSRDGRAETIRLAKLAILALSRNMEETLGGMFTKYKLEVNIKGLPSQEGLEGAPVHASTRYPYTAGSPVLKSYEKELINLEGNCSRSGLLY